MPADHPALNVLDGSTTEQGWDVRPRWIVHDFGHRQGGEGGNTKFVTLNEAEDALHHARHQAEQRLREVENSAATEMARYQAALQAERQRVEELRGTMAQAQIEFDHWLKEPGSSEELRELVEDAALVFRAALRDEAPEAEAP